MPNYRVHIYCTVRILIDITAPSPSLAAQAAESSTNIAEHIQIYETTVEYADEITGFQVDTLDPEGNMTSTCALTPSYEPVAPKSLTPPTLPEYDHLNFETLCLAISSERAALLACRDIKTGLPASLIVAVNRDKSSPSHNILVPFALLFPSDYPAEDHYDPYLPDDLSIPSPETPTPKESLPHDPPL